jgi:hypothetical protein
MKKFTQESMLEILDSTYTMAINGIPGTLSAEELANEYLKKANDIHSAAKDLTNWQIAKCGTSGFLSGLGGIIILPVALPANIISVIYVQIRMIAAIACIGGYDIQDDKVKTLVYMCLCGNGAKDIVKGVGINFGSKITTSMIEKIPGTVLTKINQGVGFRLVTKFGSKGVVNLGKMVPLAGGVIGAGFDISSTKVIANVAHETFIGPR